MLKIVYPICCGMDVHKFFVAACIATTDGCGVTTYKSKRFSTFTNDLRRCAVWLAENLAEPVLEVLPGAGGGDDIIVLELQTIRPERNFDGFQPQLT